LTPIPNATRAQPWMKFAALVLVLAALGLPLNDLPRFALLVVAAVLILTGAMSCRGWRWAAAVLVAGGCLLAQLTILGPRIEEGHNVFLVDRPGGALEAGLPPQVFQFMKAEFDARYPPERRCDPTTDGCWRGQGFPDRTFAFSADGIWDRPAHSRRVPGIDFADPVWARLGFINEGRYNWNSRFSDVVRTTRDRRAIAFLQQWQLQMPWFVMYRFPADFAGSDLCWRGGVLWEGAGGSYTPILHDTMACRTLTAEDAGRRIFGIAIRNQPPLAMRLEPTARVRAWQFAALALPLAGAATVLLLLVRPRLRRTILPFTFMALTLAVTVLNDASFVGGVRPFDSGDDGLVYDGYARVMLQHLVAGNVYEALRGVESVFYFTPGSRYLRAFEHVIFGESYLGYLAVMLFFPLLVFAVFRRFLLPRWALAMALTFAAIPIGVLFGTSLVLYVKWAARGFGDPAAFAAFLAAFILLIGATAADIRDRFAPTFAAGLLFALAVFVRPNLAPMTGILLAGAGLAALWQAQWRRLAGMCLGFMPVFGMALHNWVYGGALVLFTSTSEVAQSMPPRDYVAALAELLRLDFAGEHTMRGLKQIGHWLAGPSEWLAMAPLHLAALAVVVRMAFRRGSDPWLRLTAVAVLVQHSINLFFLPYPRYYFLTWLLTLLIVAVWLHDEGLAWMRRRWPGLARWGTGIAQRPAWRSAERGLDRMIADWDGREPPPVRPRESGDPA
jgi:hypothetical protein